MALSHAMSGWEQPEPDRAASDGPNGSTERLILDRLVQERTSARQRNWYHTLMYDAHFYSDVLHNLADYKIISRAKRDLLLGKRDVEVEEGLSTRELMQLAVEWRITTSASHFWSKHKKREDLIHCIRSERALRVMRRAEEAARDDLEPITSSVASPRPRAVHTTVETSTPRRGRQRRASLVNLQNTLTFTEYEGDRFGTQGDYIGGMVYASRRQIARSRQSRTPHTDTNKELFSKEMNFSEGEFGVPDGSGADGGSPSRFGTSPGEELEESSSSGWFPMSPSRVSDRGSFRGIFSDSSSVAKGSLSGEPTNLAQSHGLPRLVTAMDGDSQRAGMAFRQPHAQRPARVPFQAAKETATTGPKLGRHQSERYIRSSYRERQQNIEPESPRPMSEPVDNESDDDDDVCDFALEVPRALQQSLQSTKGSVAVADASEWKRDEPPVMSIEDFMNRHANPDFPRSPIRNSASGANPSSLSPFCRSLAPASDGSSPTRLTQSGPAHLGDSVANGDDGSETHLMYLPSSLRQSVPRSPPSALRAQACRKLALYTAPLEPEPLQVVVLSPRKSSSSPSGRAAQTSQSPDTQQGDGTQQGGATTARKVRRLIRSREPSHRRSRSRPMSESKKSKPTSHGAGGTQPRAATTGHHSQRNQDDWIDVIAQRGRTMGP